MKPNFSITDWQNKHLPSLLNEGTSQDRAFSILNELEGMLLNLKSNTATNSTISDVNTKQGLLQAFDEMLDKVNDLAFELEDHDY